MMRLKQVHLLGFLICLFVLSASCQQKVFDPKVATTSPADTAQNFRFQKFSTVGLPDPVGYVNDFENIFTDKEEHILDSLIDAFEKRTTIEIAVVTIDTNMLSQRSLFDFTLELANTWGVGKKDNNNGILVGICKTNKGFRIQNGYGIEPLLSDSATAEIMNKVFFPSFRKGKIFEGTFRGIQSLMAALDKAIYDKAKVTF